MNKGIAVLITALLGVLTCLGQTYSGRVIYGAIPAGQNVSVNDCVIVNSSGWCFQSLIPGATVSFKNCYFSGQGINTYRAGSLNIESCHFEAGGQVAVLIQDVGTTSAFIRVVDTDIHDGWNALVLQGVQNDPNVWFLNDRITQSSSFPHNDQVSVYQSSGTPVHRIEINHLLVVCCPDAPQVVNSGGIVAGDTGSSYVEVANTVVLNGQSNAGIAAYANGGTSLFQGNIIVGIGAHTGWSVGLSVVEGSGPAYGNTIGWWDSHYQMMRNLYQALDTRNYLLSRGQITLAYEQQLIAQWEQGWQGGWLGWSPIQLPQASEFPQ